MKTNQNLQQERVVTYKSQLFATLGNTLQESQFKDLSLFKDLIESGGSSLHQYPYTINKNKVLIYKTIFFTLSAIFAYCGWHLYSSSYNWICTAIFGNDVHVRLTICAMCTFFAIASLVLGVKISPEIEIVLNTTKTAKRKAKQLYNRKLTEICCAYNSKPIGKDDERVFMRHTYEDILEKIEHYKNETILTVKRVSISRELDDEQKEHLYNQAVLELQRKLEILTCCYKENNLSFIP